MVSYGGYLSAFQKVLSVQNYTMLLINTLAYSL